MLTKNEGTDHSYVGLLGRAKEALASSVEVAVRAEDLRPYPDQPRRHFDALALQRLAESIDAGGQTTAGIIREKPGATRYELIDGERRWRAVNMIPADRRPEYRARLIKADDDVVQYLISGIANFNREGHTALETSDTICRLVSFGLPLREIAAILGIGEQWAGYMYGLRKLTPEVRALMDPTRPQRERLPVTAAVEICKIDASLQMGLAVRVLRRDVSLVAFRGEVLKTAKAAGKEIRTMPEVVPPRRRWQRVLEQAPQLERATKTMLGQLDEGDLVVKHIKSYIPVQAEARKLAGRLSALRAEIEQIEGKLLRAAGEK